MCLCHTKLIFSKLPGPEVAASNRSLFDATTELADIDETHGPTPRPRFEEDQRESSPAFADMIGLSSAE